MFDFVIDVRNHKLSFVKKASDFVHLSLLTSEWSQFLTYVACVHELVWTMM